MADEATKAKLRAALDKLTPEDFAAVAGNREALIKKVAEAYGISEDEAKTKLHQPHPQIHLSPIDPQIPRRLQTTF
ncbi:hypothetical protein PV04_07563 [Phialophora macrospora]|uniref:Uncharacterized protein n=1 Tax=Phialophora macrospora TaxID=1851006 RepID=A0A0D2DT10_9EURO|nr:hypothetical protein PV04_07563 [Phialophora macrospora]